MPEAEKIGLGNLGEWVENETVDFVEPLRQEAKKLLEDIRDKFTDLLQASEKLLDDAEKEITKGSRKMYRRAKLLQKIAGNFADLINNLTFPEKISAEILHQFSDELEKIIEKVRQERMKCFRFISPYFIMSRRRFDVVLKRAGDAFQNFQNFLSDDYAKAESAEGIASRIEELNQSLTELNDAKKTRETRKLRLELLEKKIEENQKKMKAIKSKDEVVELVQINSRIRELEENLKHDLRHLQKPFLKFQTLVNSPGYNLSPEATRKLDEYLNNPFKAFATEQEGHPLLKSILQKINDAIDNDKLKLKKSRLRKAKDQIDNIINKTALISLHQNCRETFSKKYKLSISSAISETRSKRSELQENLKHLQRKKRILEKREAVQEKENQQLLERVEGQKRELEKVVKELVGKDVQIIVD
jgi:DNA repair exonuclease SbcCD ATPase subunit